jgi:hypothetical protein
MFLLKSILSIFLIFLQVSCGSSDESKLRNVEYADIEWTIVRRVGSAYGLDLNVPNGAKIEGNKVHRKGEGAIVYGPYKSVSRLKKFRLDAKVNLSAQYEGEQTCYKHEGSWTECINGCPRVAYDCSKAPGRIMIDVVMNHPQKGLGQDVIASKVIEVSKERKNISEVIAVGGQMERLNQDLDRVELRVAILDAWVKASVEETVLGFRGWSK